MFFCLYYLRQVSTLTYISSSPPIIHLPGNLNLTFRAHFLVFWLGLYASPEVKKPFIFVWFSLFICAVFLYFKCTSIFFYILILCNFLSFTSVLIFVHLDFFVLCMYVCIYLFCFSVHSLLSVRSNGCPRVGMTSTLKACGTIG